MVTDTRLCALTDWIKRIQYDSVVAAHTDTAAAFGEVVECLWELQADRAALAYMRDFEDRLKREKL